MRLGDLHHRLSTVDPDRLVVFSSDEPEWDGKYPGHLDSWRGVYAQLALDHDDAPCTVRVMCERLAEADGRWFHGYKGGDYLMDASTEVWADTYGCASEREIAGVVTALSGPVRIILNKEDDDA